MPRGKPHSLFTRPKKIRVPKNLVRYLCGFPPKEVLEAFIHHLKLLQLPLGEGVRFEDVQFDAKKKSSDELARILIQNGTQEHFIDSVILAQDLRKFKGFENKFWPNLRVWCLI